MANVKAINVIPEPNKVVDGCPVGIKLLEFYLPRMQFVSPVYHYVWQPGVNRHDDYTIRCKHLGEKSDNGFHCLVWRENVVPKYDNVYLTKFRIPIVVEVKCSGTCYFGMRAFRAEEAEIISAFILRGMEWMIPLIHRRYPVKIKIIDPRELLDAGEQVCYMQISGLLDCLKGIPSSGMFYRQYIPTNPPPDEIEISTVSKNEMCLREGIVGLSVDVSGWTQSTDRYYIRNRSFQAIYTCSPRLGARLKTTMNDIASWKEFSLEFQTAIVVNHPVNLIGSHFSLFQGSSCNKLAVWRTNNIYGYINPKGIYVSRLLGRDVQKWLGHHYKNNNKWPYNQVSRSFYNDILYPFNKKVRRLQVAWDNSPNNPSDFILSQGSSNLSRPFITDWSYVKIDPKDIYFDQYRIPDKYRAVYEIEIDSKPSWLVSRRIMKDSRITYSVCIAIPKVLRSGQAYTICQVTSGVPGETALVVAISKNDRWTVLARFNPKSGTALIEGTYRPFQSTTRGFSSAEPPFLKLICYRPEPEVDKWLIVKKIRTKTVETIRSINKDKAPTWSNVTNMKRLLSRAVKIMSDNEKMII
ncbi:MAG: hypothetical protein QXT45_05900 [Candidatus Bilamarchaeaceae archaeon]